MQQLTRLFLALLLFGALFVPAQPALAQVTISPVLECVINNGDGTYNAVFGYNNPNALAVSVPVGTLNRFTVAPDDRGQPTTFQPGRTVGIVSVTFSGTITWSLTGRTATASTSSTPCKSQCPWSGTPSGPVTLNGQFDDWRGQACIVDTFADCPKDTADVTAVFFTTVTNDPTAYWMLQRAAGGSQPIGIRLRVDTNNNGVYTDFVDRLVTVRYQASNSSSSVDVDLYDGGGGSLGTLASNANWGDSQAAGGRRVEWGVGFAQLGISAGQPIRFVIETAQGSANSATCDGTQEVQWSPADALGWVLLTVVLGGAAAVFARRRGARL